MTIGHMTMHIINKWIPAIDSDRHPEIRLFTFFLLGLSIITFYANLMSIFYRISFEFYGFLLFVAVTCIGLRYRTCLKSCKKSYKAIKKLPWFLFLAFAYVIIIALVSSTGGTSNFDESGYYLSIVKWAEQYPVVSGTGLLNARIAYNSAFHMTSAVFGYAFLYEGGAYDLNGLLYVCMHVLGIAAIWRLLIKKSSCVPADLLLSLALVFPFRFLIDSMDVDYPSIAIGVFVLSELIRRIHIGNFWKVDLSLVTLTLISLYLFTIRPFSIVYLIPTFLICCNLIWQRRFTFPLLTGLSCICYVFPWLYRNVMISGYLVYPIHFVDLFSVDWKIPLDLAYNNYLLIKEFAKVELIRTDYLYTGVSDLSVQEWIMPWVKNNWQLIVGKLVILVLPISVLYHLVSSFKKSNRTHFWLIRNVLLLILILWFVSFPSIRFAWAFLLSFFAMIIYDIIKTSAILRRITFIGLLVGIILSNIRTGYITLSNPSISKYIITPKKTEVIKDYTLVKTNFQFRKSKTEYCYSAIPCMPYHNDFKVVLKGERITDGFVLEE